MQGIEAIIFDMDGTLIDSLRDIAESMNHVLSDNGMRTHTLAEYRSYIGNGVSMLVSRACGYGPGEGCFDKIKREYSEYYTAHSSVYTAPFDGVDEELRRLRKRYKLAVLSNKGDRDIRALVDRYFAEIGFTAVHGQFGDFKVKPDPALALYTAEELGVEPRKILFVGDSPEDIMTGRNAGMRTAGVLWGYRDRQDLLAAGCTDFCSVPADISAVAERMCKNAGQ